MANINETAYPRFNSVVSEKELSEIYTPNQEELELSKLLTTKLQPKLCFLITLKCFQKLGYFIITNQIPKFIIQHISKVIGIFISDEQIEEYSTSTTRERHIQEIRNYLNIKVYDSSARHLIVESISKAAKTKDEPLDLINLAIEELIKNYYELPAFSTLEKTANRIKLSVNRSFYKVIFNSLNEYSISKIDKILEIQDDSQHTLWNRLKKDSSKPTITHLKELVNHFAWLKEQEIITKSIENIPYVKVKQFALEGVSPANRGKSPIRIFSHNKPLKILG